MIDGLSTLFNSFAELLSPIVEFIIWIFPIKIYRIHDGERGVILTLGKTRKWRRHERSPGVTLCFMCETLRKAQCVGKYSDMPEQCLYSKDGFPLIVNLGVIYDIVCIRTALLGVEKIEPMVEGVIMDFAREYARTHKMQDIVQRKDIAKTVIKDSAEDFAKWGIKIVDIIFTDLRPHNIMLMGEMLDRINKTGIKVNLAREPIFTNPA